MIRAGLLAVSAVVLFFPTFAFSLDRSECRQYGGSTDCWAPIVGQWKYEVCGEVGSFPSWIIAKCEAQGGQWDGNTCLGVPAPELQRATTEGDISPLAEDTFFHFRKPLCDGPDSAAWQWGGTVSSLNCFSGTGAVFSHGYEIANNTAHFLVTGKQVNPDTSCSTTVTSLNFSAKRDRVVECPGRDDQAMWFTEGSTPALCTLFWNKPINPKQCPDCEAKSRNPIHVGNPIDPITLVKRQVELDYAGSGPHSLRLERIYHSRAYTIDGKVWRHSYSSWINHQTFGTVPVALAHRANGRTFTFTFNGTGYVADVDVDDELTKLVDGSGAHIGWSYYEAPTERTETYDLDGKLVSIADRAGLTQTLAYSTAATPPAVAPRPGLLIQVTDAFGRSLSFTYDALGRIITMQDPAGQAYSYNYLSQLGPLGVTYDLVTSVTYPDLKTRTYVYNEASLITGSIFEGRLTGIVDENNARFASYAYSNGFANRTEHAGVVNRYTVSFGFWPNSVTVTDPRGTDRTYAYQVRNGVYLNTSITQPAGSGAGTAQSTKTYDANGNLATFTDFNGNRTNYSFDLARNLETSRTEGLTSAGAATPQTRTITTAWHASFRLPTQIAEPLRITTNVYDADGSACGARGALCSRTIQATTDTNGSQAFAATATGNPRTWTYTYNANGSVLTVNGPRTDVADVTSYTYYANNHLDVEKRGQSSIPITSTRRG